MGSEFRGYTTLFSYSNHEESLRMRTQNMVVEGGLDDLTLVTSKRVGMHFPSNSPLSDLVYFSALLTI